MTNSTLLSNSAPHISMHAKCIYPHPHPVPVTVSRLPYRGQQHRCQRWEHPGRPHRLPAAVHEGHAHTRTTALGEGSSSAAQSFRLRGSQHIALGQTAVNFEQQQQQPQFAQQTAHTDGLACEGLQCRPHSFETEANALRIANHTADGIPALSQTRRGGTIQIRQSHGGSSVSIDHILRVDTNLLKPFFPHDRMPDKFANVNIPIRNGVLSLRPKKLDADEVESNLLENLDEDTLNQIKTLHENLQMIVNKASQAVFK